MEMLLKEEYPDYLNSFSKEYGQTLRVNRLKAEPADLIRRFLLTQEKGSDTESDSLCHLFDPVPWCRDGFYYHGTKRLSLHPWYHAGLWYLQEPSAMGPAAFLPVRPGDRVLDLCAAPGGKSTALAGKLEGRGFLVANDISASRCKALVKNLELAGVANALVTCEKPGKLAAHFPLFFDGLLVDAPCSGEGMFRKDPSMIKFWSPEEVSRYSGLQKEILSSAYDMLRPGGHLLYSTCTYSPEEDEQVIYDFIREHPDMKLVPIGRGRHEPVRDSDWPEDGHPEWIREVSPEGEEEKTETEDLRYSKRFWSHKLSGEGQFAALMRKEKGPEPADDLPAGEEKRTLFAKQSVTDKSVDAFLEDCDLRRLCSGGSRTVRIKDQVYLIPRIFPGTEGLRVIRSGLLLGEIRRKRFEPSQALAMALEPQEYRRVWNLAASDQEVIRYLKGETIPCPGEEGYTLVCVDGFSLGWGKCGGGRLKNKYKSSWRMM